MQPQPLFRVLADPPFDHSGDDLHSGGDIDLAFGVARRSDRVGHFAAEAVFGAGKDDAASLDHFFLYKEDGQPKDLLAVIRFECPGWFDPASAEPAPSDFATQEANQYLWASRVTFAFAFALRAELEK